MNIDHLGIATNDAAGQAAVYTDLLDADVVHEEEREGLAVTFIGFDTGGYLELLEPLPDADPEGPIPRYLDRRGPGLHHLAINTDDLDATLRAADAADIALIDEDPRPGAWDSRIAFVHPDATGGVLLELVER